MDEKSTIKDLENQVRNTRLYVDRINKAYYGMTWDEYIKALGNRKEDSEDGANIPRD